MSLNVDLQCRISTEQVYQLEEIESGFWKLIEILNKIKAELKINSFLEFADYFDYLYDKIVAKQYIANKTLTFMGG